MVTTKEFRRWQKDHPNFITPYVERLKQVNDTFIELSSGTDFDHKPMYGVSVIRSEEGKFRTVQDVGMPFSDRQKADKYMDRMSRVASACTSQKGNEFDNCIKRLLPKV